MNAIKRGLVPLFLSVLISTKVAAVNTSVNDGSATNVGASLAGDADFNIAGVNNATEISESVERALARWNHEPDLRAQFHQLLRLKEKAKTLDENTLNSPDAQKFYLTSIDSRPVDEFIALINARPENVVCRFPARILWLKNHGLIDSFDIEKCAGLLSVDEIKNHPQVSLVFSSYNLDYPSSAFGHTFLRLSDGSTYDGYAIGFSVLNMKLDMITALRTLIGSAEGQFTLEPYVTKRTEYVLTESRDLWESVLTRSFYSAAYLYYHVAELRQIPLSYSYFSRNCASEIYLLLGLVAELSGEKNLLSARESHHTFELPIHVLKNLSNHELHFTPSHRRKIEEHEWVRLNKHSAQAVYDWSHSPVRKSSLVALTDFQSLDFAKEVLQVKVYEDDAPELNEELWKIRRKLSGFSVIEKNSAITRSTASAPVDLYAPYRTHSTSKFAVGAEHAQRDGMSVLYRPALHGPTDPKRGYDSANHIEMGQTQFVWSGKDLYLKEFTFYKINSTERSPFTRNLSWASELTHQSRRWSGEFGESFINGHIGRAWSVGLSSFHVLAAVEAGSTERIIGSGVRSGYVRLFPEARWTFGVGNHFNGFVQIRPFDSMKSIDSFAHLQTRAELQWTDDSEWFIGISYKSLGNIFNSTAHPSKRSEVDRLRQVVSAQVGLFF